MDFSYLKFILFFNKNKISKTSELCNYFNISLGEAFEVLNILCKKGYVTYEDNNYIPTYKCKHFILSSIMSFVNINIIDILALLVSIIALIISIAK